MLIGLTGGIASGKSTVSQLFQKYGIPIVDADLVAREVVEPGQVAWKKIVESFGEDILLSDMTINRKKLGDTIFQNAEKRNVLNNITHPIIISAMMNKAKELEKSHQIVILDIPLLFESKREELFNFIILVYVNSTIQLQRLMARDKINRNDAFYKITSQMSLEEKKEKANIIIYNDDKIEKTEEQVLNIIKKLSRKLD